jgi:hypothetical protein
MAAFVTINDDVPGDGAYPIIAGALNQDPASMARLARLPRFRVQGTTDSNEAAASSPVIDLTAKGIAFPASTYRDIEVHVWAANGAATYTFRTRQRVLGGATPALEGGERFLTNCRATWVATLSSGAPTEVDAECIPPEWWDGAIPLGGDFSNGAGVIQWLGANSPVRALTPLPAVVSATTPAVTNAVPIDHKVTSLANGTSTLLTANLDGTEAVLNAADGRIIAEAILYPPVHAPVLISTANVIVGALGISSDAVRWIVDVFVGDTTRLVQA